jgi:hypothetical protein
VSQHAPRPLQSRPNSTATRPKTLVNGLTVATAAAPLDAEAPADSVALPNVSELAVEGSVEVALLALLSSLLDGAEPDAVVDDGAPVATIFLA